MKNHWLDERIHLGEVPETSRTKAADRRASPEGAKAAHDLGLDDAEILRRLPPARLAERIEARRESRSTRPSRSIHTSWIPLAVAACALLVAFLATPSTEVGSAPREVATALPATDSTPSILPTPPRRDSIRTDLVAVAEVPDAGIRMRGDGGLSVLLVDPVGVASAASEAVVGGSTLRLVAPFTANGAIFSLDETGAIQRHWPLAGDSSRALPAGPLPRDWETDLSPGWDRFVLVTSETPFALRTVEAHLRGVLASKDPKHRRIVLPGGLEAGDRLVERKAP